MCEMLEMSSVLVCVCVCLLGREGAQVSHLRSGVHTAGQHEASRSDSHQRASVSVSPVLQELRSETDAKGSHDRPLGHQTLQMQGVSLDLNFSTYTLEYI